MALSRYDVDTSRSHVRPINAALTLPDALPLIELSLADSLAPPNDWALWGHTARRLRVCRIVPAAHVQHASGIGATVRLELPAITTPRLAVEYYKHDSLPLGMVNASLSWRGSGLRRTAHHDIASNAASSPAPVITRATTLPTTNRHSHVISHVLLDGRCTTADACPKGQGFYFSSRVADGLSLAEPADGATAAGRSMPSDVRAELQLTVVPRTDGIRNANGTDEFSVVSIIAEL